MKNMLAMLLSLALIIIAIPCLSLLTKGEKDTQAPASSQGEDAVYKSTSDTVKVFLSQDKSVVELSDEEYLVGCVAAEMPAGYDIEALKAQAAVSYTYLISLRLNPGASDKKEISGADISDSSQTHQGYINKEERQKKWGDNFERYEKKILEAVNAVRGKVITYNGKPITAAYHAISTGRTEDAQNVWGGEVSYLKAVTSDGDRLSPNFESELAVTPQELKQKLQGEGVSFSDNPEEWIGKEISATESGTVTLISIGGKAFTGQQIRAALSLKSAAFTAAYSNGSFIFKTAGYGHLVGMSQYGADYMARQGGKWDEIIRHYYTDVEITDIEALDG